MDTRTHRTPIYKYRKVFFILKGLCPLTPAKDPFRKGPLETPKLCEKKGIIRFCKAVV